MKKRIIVLVMALLLIPIAALSFTPELWMRVSTGNTADSQIQGVAPTSTVEGYFYGIIVHTDGTNAVDVEVSDSIVSAQTDNSAGAILVSDWTVTTSSTDRTQSISYDPPVPYQYGIYVDVSSAGTIAYDIYYHNSDD